MLCSVTAQAFTPSYSEQLKWENNAKRIQSNAREEVLGKLITSMCSSAKGVHAVWGIGGSCFLPPSPLQIQSPCSEALPVLHVSEIAECQAENFPDSDGCNGCVMGVLHHSNLCSAVRRRGRPAGRSSPSTHVLPGAGHPYRSRDFLGSVGVEFRNIYSSVNGIKLPMKACCFSHAWKQISSGAVKSLSLLRLKIMIEKLSCYS